MDERVDPALVTAMRRVRAVADGEGLILWTRAHIAECLQDVDPAPLMTTLAGSHLVHPYRAGRPQATYAYLVGAERPGEISTLPPPSIQNGANRNVYHQRDHWMCHLCGGQCTTAWNRRREWPSLDHLVAQHFGGSSYPSNLSTAHVSCNKARRERPIEAFTGSPLTRATRLAVRAVRP